MKHRPSLILNNGRIYDVKGGRADLGSIVIGGSRITWAGDSRGATSSAGIGAEMVDLDGRLVIPGLIDAHTHPRSVALASWHTILPWSYDPNVQLTHLKEQVSKHPEQDVIYAEYYPSTTFSPDNLLTAALINRYVSDKAVIWEDSSDHACCLNTRAIELMGITRDTPDPEPGTAYFKRDEAGNPTGYVTEAIDNGDEQTVEFIGLTNHCGRLACAVSSDNSAPGG